MGHSDLPGHPQDGCSSVFLGDADLRVCHWGRMTLGSQFSEAAPSNWAKAICFFVAIWPGRHAGQFRFFLSPVRSLLRETQGVVILMQSISLPKSQPPPAEQDWNGFHCFLQPRTVASSPPALGIRSWKGSKQDAGCIQSPESLECHACSWVSVGVVPATSWEAQAPPSKAGGPLCQLL